MTPTQYILIAVAVLLGTAIQTAVGFGCGLFAIPIMVWVGLPLPEAIAATLAVVLFQTGLNCWQYRRDVPWRQVLPVSVLRLVTIPAGIWLLTLLVDIGQSRIKQVIGIVLLATLLAQWSFKVRPRDRVHGGWTFLTGVTSGVLVGMVGMGGPPLVLWVMAHDWPSQRARACMWAVFLMAMPFHLAMIMFQFGGPVVHAVLIGLAMIPVAGVGMFVGTRIGDTLSRQRLRLAAFALLVALAVTSIVGPMI